MVLVYKKGRENVEELKEIFNDLEFEHFSSYFGCFIVSDNDVIIKSWGMPGELISPGLRNMKLKYDNILRIDYSKNIKQIQIDLLDESNILIHCTK